MQTTKKYQFHSEKIDFLINFWPQNFIIQAKLDELADQTRLLVYCTLDFAPNLQTFFLIMNKIFSFLCEWKLRFILAYINLTEVLLFFSKQGGSFLIYFQITFTGFFHTYHLKQYRFVLKFCFILVCFSENNHESFCNSSVMS